MAGVLLEPYDIKSRNDALAKYLHLWMWPEKWKQFGDKPNWAIMEQLYRYNFNKGKMKQAEFEAWKKDLRAKIGQTYPEGSDQHTVMLGVLLTMDRNRGSDPGGLQPTGVTGMDPNKSFWSEVIKERNFYGLVSDSWHYNDFDNQDLEAEYIRLKKLEQQWNWAGIPTGAGVTAEVASAAGKEIPYVGTVLTGAGLLSYGQQFVLRRHQESVDDVLRSRIPTGKQQPKHMGPYPYTQEEYNALSTKLLHIDDQPDNK